MCVDQNKALFENNASKCFKLPDRLQSELNDYIKIQFYYTMSPTLTYQYIAIIIVYKKFLTFLRFFLQIIVDILAFRLLINILMRFDSSLHILTQKLNLVSFSSSFNS